MLEYRSSRVQPLFVMDSLAQLTLLSARIESRNAVIGVIGLGYVGLSIATALAAAGFRVVGVEVKPDRVAAINAGRCPIEGVEPDLPELMARVTASKHLVAVTDHAPLAEADVVLIDVDTPVASDHRPHFEALRSACCLYARVMKRGALVIVESTVAPGTTERLVAPLLEEVSGKKLNEGFFLGHCPQRVMPGKLLKNLRTVSRVCGGANPQTAQVMALLYSTVVKARIDETDLVTAELVKTAENTYRDVKIAFANELGLVCEAAGGDFRRVRELVAGSAGQDMLLSGAGVGGHCIPKDPWLLVHGAGGVEPRLVTAARAVNDRMPLHMARLVEDGLDEAGVAVAGARIVVLGYAYLENTGDTRNSPSEVLVGCLRDRGADMVVPDPWVAEHAGDLWERAQGAHAVVLMVAHDEYRDLDLERLGRIVATRVLVDGRHVVEDEVAHRAGFVFRALGRAKLRKP
jgi:UDP-N-acetyl-D-mannosaminuronic acid dehydrogenase